MDNNLVNSIDTNRIATDNSGTRTTGLAAIQSIMRERC